MTLRRYECDDARFLIGLLYKVIKKYRSQSPIGAGVAHSYCIDFLEMKCIYSRVPRRRYSRDKIPAHRANPDTSVLLGKFPPPCDENQNYTSWELFATHCCLSWILNIFDFFHIQGLHIFASTLSDFP
jgi:hypothetical protein